MPSASFFVRRVVPMGLVLSLVLGLCACSDGDPSMSSPQKMRDMLDALGGPKVEGVEQTMLANAQTAEADGDLARAGSFYAQLHDRTPDKREWELALADVQRRTNGCNDALAHYEALVKKDAKDVLAMEGKALCLMNIGETKEASQTLTQVLAIDPGRWRALNAVGVLFASKGKVPESIAYFEKATEVDGTQLAVMNNLGLAYLLDKRYAQAIETFQRAQKRLPSKSPEKPRIDMNLALAYALSGDMENAQKFAAPHVSEAGLYNNLGFFAKLSKDERLARDYLNMALSKSPTYYKRAWDNLDLVRRDTQGDIADDHGVKIETGTVSTQRPMVNNAKTRPVPAKEGRSLEVITPQQAGLTGGRTALEKSQENDRGGIDLPSIPPSKAAGLGETPLLPAATPMPPAAVEKDDAPAIQTP